MLDKIQVNDIVTAPVAGVAITSPVWRQWVEDAGSFATDLMPIVGVIWLILQIYAKIRREWGDK